MILTWSALDISITNKTRQADANHGSQRQCVDDRALAVGAARFGLSARILAFATEASQLAGAVSIHGALGRRGKYRLHVAGGVRVADVARRARAARNVIGDSALRSRSATARIFATFISASQVVGALLVGGALGARALDVRVAAVAVRAVAAGLVAFHSALGVCSALSVPARILALAIDACLSRRTLRI